jgi:rod shape-determining protein MreD
MRTFAIIVCGWLLLVLQSALWRYLPFDTVSPDLWAVFAVYLGLHAQEGRGPSAVGAALALGFVFDALAGAPSGLFGFASAFLALVAVSLSKRLLLRGRLAVGGAGAVASVVGALAILALMTVEGGPVVLNWRLIWLLVLQAVMTALFTPGIFWLLRRVEARTDRQRARDLAREGVLR